MAEPVRAEHESAPHCFFFTIKGFSRGLRDSAVVGRYRVRSATGQQLAGVYCTISPIHTVTKPFVMEQLPLLVLPTERNCLHNMQILG